MKFVSNILTSISVGLFNFLTPPSTLQDPTSQPTNQSSLNSTTFNAQTYNYHYFIVDQPQNLTLHSNLDQKQDSTQLVKDFQCQSLINGNFYDDSDNHLGWLYNYPNQISPTRTNDLFNGYLYLDSSNQLHLDTSNPNHQVIWGIQSGPILISNNYPRKLTLNTDQSRRRSLAAITDQNQLILLMITDNSSQLLGPSLTQLPNILTQIATEQNWQLTNAINLDGGSASAFYHQDTHINEINPIGSFFCLKE